MARSRIASEERLFSLVLALVASTQGLTKHALLSSVYGYSDRYGTGHGDARAREAFHRQFERDKERLRSLGIPVETIESPGEPGNNQLSRYRISKEALEVPEGLTFSDRELMLLRMAVLAWREGSLTDEARRATMKLEAIGAGVAAPSGGVVADFGMTEHSAPALLAAVEHGRAARFEYQLPTRNTPMRRDVLPLQLHRVEGRWHLIAFDIERRAPRVFLLSRIVGEVATRDVDRAEILLPAASTDEVSSEAIHLERSIATIIAESLTGLEALRRSQRARVLARRSSDAEHQLRTRLDAREPENESNGQGSTHVELEFGTTDLHELASLLASFGEDVEVLAPRELREQTVLILDRLAASHSGASPHNARSLGGGNEQ